MPLAYDPEIEPVATAMLEMRRGVPQPAVGDWQAIRERNETALAMGRDAIPARDDVTFAEHQATARDGRSVPLRWYTAVDRPAPGSAVVYLHGGGMISGNVDLYDRVVRAYVGETGVPMLAVDYRLAPSDDPTDLVEDCHTALVWLVDRSAELGVDRTRVAAMGDSAGAGLAAGLALIARDRGPTLARQILVYPMLDDRTPVDPALAPTAVWTYESNETAWGALLGETYHTDDASPFAAPARANDLSGAAPAYVEVGELDIFREEVIEYARRLSAAGTPTELHVHSGAPHGFDALAPKAAVSRRAMADRERVLREL